MLIIDDTMFKLAKMQENLLRISNVNREENLKYYQEIVLKIDSKAFSSILEEIKRVSENSQSLENELSFLEEVEKAYNQLLELQIKFKDVCELYGDSDFKLSDLSRLNIEYIKNRINAIKSYLTNDKNIKTNEEEIESLNTQLSEQLKQKTLLDGRLLGFENSLRESFVNTEGRLVIDDRLVSTSVMLEYKKLNLDLNLLLSDLRLLDDTLSNASKAKMDAFDTLKTMEFCYNSMLTDESKQFFENAKVDYLKAEYLLIMLKMVKLLSENHTEYEKVIKKREDLLELIEDRFACLKCLGVVQLKDKDLDPFVRTKVKEQCDVLESLRGLVKNTMNIDKLTKKISDLVELTEQMINQKPQIQLQLADTRELVKSSVSINDIDISNVDLPEDEVVSKKILPNQVVGVRSVSSKLNSDRVSQKTSGVIRRVSMMVNRSTLPKETSISTSVTPKLVIVPSVSEVTTNVLDVDTSENDKQEVLDVYDEMIEVDEVTESDKKEKQVLDTELMQKEIDNDLFETVIPFSSPKMFSDRSDENQMSDSAKVIDFPVLNYEENDDESMIDEEENEFWVSQSFSDDQIGEMLSLDVIDNNKVRRKAA